MRWQKHDLLTWLDNTLFNSAGQDISDALDLIDARNWHPHGCTYWSLRHTAHLVKNIVQCINMKLLLAKFNIKTFPPVHVVRLLQEVVAHPTRDGKNWCALLNEILLPTNLHQHALHLICDLIIAGLLITSRITVHLIYTYANLLHAQQIDQARMLA